MEAGCFVLLLFLLLWKLPIFFANS